MVFVQRASDQGNGDSEERSGGVESGGLGCMKVRQLTQNQAVWQFRKATIRNSGS